MVFDVVGFFPLVSGWVSFPPGPILGSVFLCRCFNMISTALGGTFDPSSKTCTFFYPIRQPARDAKRGGGRGKGGPVSASSPSSAQFVGHRVSAGAGTARALIQVPLRSGQGPSVSVCLHSVLPFSVGSRRSFRPFRPYFRVCLWQCPQKAHCNRRCWRAQAGPVDLQTR